MRAAVACVNVVGKREKYLGIRGGVLHSNLDHHILALRFKVDNIIVQGVFAAVNICYKFLNAALRVKRYGFGVFNAVVCEKNFNALIEKRLFA